MRDRKSLPLVVCILALDVLVLELGFSAQALHTAAAGDIPPGLTARSYLPYVAAAPTPTPPPEPLGLKVYDMYGVQRTYQWAVNKYGVRVEQRAGWGYHCVELRERTGPASIDVWVYQSNGLAAPNVRVEFWWPDGVAVAYTEVTGKAGFAYGPGAWITDPAVGGPHWLVVSNTSYCAAVSRLGMLAGTDHDHLDVSYRYGLLSP